MPWWVYQQCIDIEVPSDEKVTIGGDATFFVANWNKLKAHIGNPAISGSILHLPKKEDEIFFSERHTVSVWNPREIQSFPANVTEIHCHYKSQSSGYQGVKAALICLSWSCKWWRMIFDSKATCVGWPLLCCFLFLVLWEIEWSKFLELLPRHSWVVA